LLFTDWKSLKEVEIAHRKGATIKTVQRIIKVYFKNLYSFSIIL